MEIMINLNLNLLILVTFFHRIRGGFFKIQEQGEIGSKQLKVSPEKSLSKIVITPAFITAGEKFYDNKVGKLIVKNSYLNKILEEDHTEGRTVNLREKRTLGCSAVPDEDLFEALNCFSCYGNGTSKKDNKCYNAQKLRVIKCARREKCYTEVHPNYIRRGCKLQSLLNRTHVCKCPLCNDKPSNDSSYYDYNKIGDWKYDNRRLEVPLVGIDLFCKVCATNGTNHKIDEACKIGTNADSTICKRNQLCYTNVDGKNNYVSRGCINRPTYNSIYFFCQASLCNNRTFYNFKSNSREITLVRSSDIMLTPTKIAHYFKLYFFIILCNSIEI